MRGRRTDERARDVPTLYRRKEFKYRIRGHLGEIAAFFGTENSIFRSDSMIDSLFILGEDKQIVIEKHWKQTIDRSVLEPYFAALAKYVDSNVWIHFGRRYVSRIFLPFWKVASVRS